jgi:hypothetical protein
VAQISPKLRVAFMNYEWLTQFLKENPRALRHYLMKENDNSDKTFVIVTAETADLQKFVLKHYSNTNAWSEEGVLTREPAKAKE